MNCGFETTGRAPHNAVGDALIASSATRLDRDEDLLFQDGLDDISTAEDLCRMACEAGAARPHRDTFTGDERARGRNSDAAP
jgi:hypothetical protein